MNATNIDITLPNLKDKIRKRTLRKWQNHWAYAPDGRHLHEICPNVTRSTYKSVGIRRAEVRLNRLRLGHTLLKVHQHKRHLVESPACDCGKDNASPEHTLLHCNLNEISRNRMLRNLERIYTQHDIPIYLRDVNYRDMIGFWHHLPANIRIEVESTVGYFVNSIKANV